MSAEESGDMEEIRRRRLAYFETQSSRENTPLNSPKKVPNSNIREPEYPSETHDAGGWKHIDTNSSRSITSNVDDEFEQLKEQLKTVPSTDEEAYNELVEKLIDCSKRGIVEREKGLRSRSSSLLSLTNNEENQELHTSHVRKRRDSGSFPCDREDLGQKVNTESLISYEKQRQNKPHSSKPPLPHHSFNPPKPQRVNDVDDLFVERKKHAKKLLKGSNSQKFSLYDSQDSRVNFQKSVDLEHIENIGLETHRPESERTDVSSKILDEPQNSTDQFTKNRSPRVLSEVTMSDDMKYTHSDNNERKYHEILEKSRKDSDETFEESLGSKYPNRSSIKEDPSGLSHKPLIRMDTKLESYRSTDDDKSTLTNGTFTEVTRTTDFDRGQEPTRPLLNRPKYDHIRNVYQQNKEDPPQNYEQITMPRNIVYSADQIYQQAYKGGMLSQSVPGPPYHQDFAMNPPMIGGYQYNVYDPPSPYYASSPPAFHQGYPASPNPMAGSVPFMFPGFPVQGGVPHPVHGVPHARVMDNYAPQVSNRSSYDGSDVFKYMSQPYPANKIPHPPEPKSSSDAKPPLPNKSNMNHKMPQPVYHSGEHYLQHMMSPRRLSQSAEIGEFKSYLQTMPKGIPYPPPPENVDLQAYFHHLSSQGYPIPYPMMMAQPEEQGDITPGKTTNYDVKIPHPPAQKKNVGMSPRQMDGRRGEVGRHVRRSSQGEITPDGSTSSQRHIDGIRQFHEQKRCQQQEEEIMLDKQRKFAKASIDRYFNSLENLYFRDKGVDGGQSENAEVVEENDEAGTEYQDTVVETEVSQATVSAVGITGRMEKLGIDLSFLKESRDLESDNHGVKRHGSSQNGDQDMGSNSFREKLVIVCPECGEINKQYMTWCGDCSEVLIGIDPVVIKSATKTRTKRKISRKPERGQETNMSVNNKDESLKQNDELLHVNSLSPDYQVSPKGKMSPNKSESRDSGRPSSEDLDFGRTEKEVIDICENITDPLVKGFIKSYFNKKRQALEDTKKSLNLVEDDNNAKPEKDYLDVKEQNGSQPQSRDTEISLDLHDEQLQNEDVWYHEHEQIEKMSRPLKGRKSGSIDVEVFPLEESRQSRNSSRMEPLVPSLNLANSSDEEDDAPKGPLRPTSMSVDSDDWEMLFEAPKDSPNQEDVVEPEPEPEPEPDPPLLAQIIGEDKNFKSKKPPPSADAMKAKKTNPVKSKVRSSIESPGYQRHWQRSSISWNSYHPRELSTTSSIKGSQSSKGRPSSAAQRKGPKHAGSMDSLLHQDGEDTSSRQIGRGRKVRPASADISKRRRPTSANSHLRNSMDLGEGLNHLGEPTLFCPTPPRTPKEVNTPSSVSTLTSEITEQNRPSKSRAERNDRVRSADNSSKKSERRSDQSFSSSKRGHDSENSRKSRDSPPQPSEIGTPVSVVEDVVSEVNTEYQEVIPSNVPKSVTSKKPFDQKSSQSSSSTKRDRKQSASGVPDSPPSNLPYVVDHRLPAEEVQDPPVSAHTNAVSVMNAYNKYYEMTPRIQTGKFSAWLCLPDEILLHVFSYLSHRDLVSCALTCTSFHRVAMDESLWKYITVKKKHNLTDETIAQIGMHHPASLALIQCHGDDITAKGLRDLFRECGSSLRELNFCGCSRGALMGDCILLHASARCHCLTHVDASWCHVTDSGIGAISGSSDRLESLCINGCQMISDEGLETVIKKHGKTLRHLEMFGCFNITPKGMRYLANHCSNLVTLNLGQCYKLNDTCISQLSASLGKVENLDLRGCKQIKDNCIRSVVKNCPQLKTITLANCPNITDVSMLEISTYINDIRNIDVCGCRNITDHSIRALSNNCQNLRNIDISSTGCTHRSVSMLANFCNQRLESVKLNFLTDVTDSVLVKLAKHCKRLKLVHLYGCTSIRHSSKIREANTNLTVEM